MVFCAFIACPEIPFGAEHPPSMSDKMCSPSEGFTTGMQILSQVVFVMCGLVDLYTVTLYCIGHECMICCILHIFNSHTSL